jgi:hypothetical protein
MKKNIIVDHVNQRIRMNRDFERRAANAESAEYALLQSVMAQYPKYALHSGVIKKKENKESYKGLTYTYMEDYISMRGSDADREEYRQMRLLAQCHTVRYPAIKAWFLEKYPEVAQYGAKAEFVSAPMMVA